ncbi:MAG: sulfatase [Verrucomicrobiaceae bacterium]|nr:sulfatase [Verrucomicrobiaceae bacterium]
MRTAVTIILCLSFAISVACAEPLNVLFIAVDDLNTQLGCYGDARVKTPNIDRLAARGVRFDRAYCQYPSCGPSRASVLTGLRPETTGVLNNKTRLRDALPDAMTLPQWFRKQGYHAARVGKIFHQDVPTHIGTDGLDDAESWDEVVNPRGRDKDEEHLLTVHTPDLPLPDQMAYLAAEGTDAEQTDGMVAEAAIRLLRAHSAKPFFIAAGFYRPHLPSIAPRRWFDLYSMEETMLPKLPLDYRLSLPAAALSSTPVWPNFGTTERQARECVLAYHATVSFVDAQIGRLLDALDELKLADQTVIVLWGDHGFHLGEHGLWRKNSLFEESTRAPLIIAAPGVAGGTACVSPVEFIDIFPTVVAAAGLPQPQGLEGVSLEPLLRDPAAPHDRPARSMVRFGDVPGRTVRSARWRYTEWGVDGAVGRELYDEMADPKEMRNLANDPAQAARCAEMKKLLLGGR